MQPKDIGAAYNQITYLWQRADFDRQNGIQQHIRALAFLTKRRGEALDVGCGCTGRFIELLQRHGLTVEGVDVSEHMVALAKQRHPDCEIHHADICSWEIPKRYDFISAWDSIWHVPLSAQTSVISKLVDSLNPGGVMIFSFGGTAKPDEHTNTAMGPEIYYSTLGVDGFLTLLLQLGCRCCHLEFDQYPELHCYMVVQKN